MNDTQLLERLTAAYESVEAPMPSAALVELMDAGGMASRDDERRDAVVVPFVRPRSRVRMRYLVAALVASFVAVSGLAAAGALPDSLQRQVSSVVSHLGIDLPSPAPAHGDDQPHVPSGTNGSDRSARTPNSTSAPAAGTDEPIDAPAASGTTVPAPGATPTTRPATTPAAPSLGDVGAVGDGSTPTTLPGGDALGLPPVTLPAVTLPPLTLPQITLPPVTLPQLPLPLPPLPLLGL
jgi:hypothetical protein